MTPEARIAEALVLHTFDYEYDRCRCGFDVELEHAEDWHAGFAAHQAAVIAALPDIAIVPQVQHPYFVWEQGYQASVADERGSIVCGGRIHTSNPYSFGDPVPDSAAGGES